MTEETAGSPDSARRVLLTTTFFMPRGSTGSPAPLGRSRGRPPWRRTGPAGRWDPCGGELGTCARRNQARIGFDWMGRAWPDPDAEHAASRGVCEERCGGETPREATRRCADRAFFAGPTPSRSRDAGSDYQLGQQGRMTEPLVLRAGGTHMSRSRGTTPSRWSRRRCAALTAGRGGVRDQRRHQQGALRVPRVSARHQGGGGFDAGRRPYRQGRFLGNISR